MTVLRYSNEELMQFQQILETKLKETMCEYNSALWQLTHASASPQDTKKEDENLQKDLLYIRAARLKRNVDNLRSAMLRIDNKTYGICIVSGTLIPKQRLLAVPH